MNSTKARTVLGLVVAAALALGASGCSAEPSPSSDDPKPTAAAEATTVPTPPPFTYADGDKLTAKTTTAWHTTLGEGDGWTEDEGSPHPGRMFQNEEGTCQAQINEFWIEDELKIWDDGEASNASVVLNINAAPESATESDVINRTVPRYGAGGGVVQAREFSAIGSSGGLITIARNFVESGWTHAIVVMCDGGDVREATEHVVSVSALEVSGPGT